MQQWEYQVIHLNVDSSGGNKDAAAPDGSSSSSIQPPFTKTYLEQEFPNYYGPQQAPGPGAPPPSASSPQPPQHPAVQLQGFINNHGLQGWELLGIFPLGALLMMIFRRPLPSVAQPAMAVAAVQPPAHPSGPTAEQGALAEILQRLQELEARLPAAPGPRPKGDGPDPERSAPLNPAEPPWVLGPDVLAGLQDVAPCSTAEAARSLGFRSAASLLNQVSRHGYPIGLVRLGRQGKAAVYQGQAPNQRGGRDTRLWLVLDSSRLPAPPT